MTSLLLSLFFSFNAHAVVLPGAFVPQQCGPQTIDVAHKDTHVMQAACVGFISGTKTRAVQFTMSDDTTYLFRVAGQSNLMMALQSGATMSVFRLVGAGGEEIAMKAILNHDGSVKSLSGEFQTNSYLVPVLQQMLTLQ
jgi:hypothetical protein